VLGVFGWLVKQQWNNTQSLHKGLWDSVAL